MYYYMFPHLFLSFPRSWNELLTLIIKSVYAFSLLILGLLNSITSYIYVYLHYELFTIICVVSILFYFAFIKIKYPFWNLQPVFHTYDLCRYFYTQPFIIHQYGPLKTKFNNDSLVKTYNYSEITEIQKKSFINLIQSYQTPDDSLLRMVSKNSMDTTFAGNNEPSWLSLYCECYCDILDISSNSWYSSTSLSPNSSSLSDTSSIKLKYTDPIGCITSRPYHFNIDGHKQNIYYLDYICVDKHVKDTKKIYRTLLQTHEYNQRIRCPHIPVSFIKTVDIPVYGVVPILQYISYTYSMNNFVITPLPDNINCVHIYKENKNILTDFIEDEINMGSWDIHAIPSLGSIHSLVNSQLYYVFCLQRHNEILGYYFFKDGFLHDDSTSSDTFICIGSKATRSLSKETFFLGFIHSMKRLFEIKQSYKTLVMEGTSHNVYLIEPLNRVLGSGKTFHSQIYMYNYSFPYRQINPVNSFMLI